MHLQAEFATFTSKINKDRKNEAKKLKKADQKEFLQNLKADSNLTDSECNECDVNMESDQKLMSHVRIQHMITKSIQTEEKEEDVKAQCNWESIDENTTKEDFQKFKCFYCDVVIANDEQLKQHIGKCRGSTRMFCTAPLGLPSGFSSGFSQPRRMSSLTSPFCGHTFSLQSHQAQTDL